MQNNFKPLIHVIIFRNLVNIIETRACQSLKKRSTVTLRRTGMHVWREVERMNTGHNGERKKKIANEIKTIFFYRVLR